MDFTFNSLPYEIQMQICSYLTWAELQQLFAPVCKKWKLLASKHVLVKDILIDGDELSMEDSLSTKRPLMENMIIGLKCYKLKIIGFFRIPNWYALSRGLPAYNYLRRLEFHDCKISPVCTKRLVARFPAIEGVKLVFRSGQVDLSVIKQITKWRRLKDILIEVKGHQPLFEEIGTEVVETFATNCELLRSVEMLNIYVWGRAITTLTDLRGETLEKLNIIFRMDAFFLMETNCFAHCLEKCPNLKVLYVTRDCCSASFKNNLLLEELHVTTIYKFDFFLREVVLKYLTKLEIVYSPSSAQLLPTHCPALKWLAIKHNNTCDDDFVYIARYCRNLEHMVVESCSDVTSKALRDIVNLETISSLNCVEFLWCAVFKSTDDILIAARLLKPNLIIVIDQCGFWKN